MSHGCQTCTSPGCSSLAPSARPAYAALTAVWAQTEADAQRLRHMGAPVQGVFGNLKFDAKGDVEDFKFVVYEWHFGKPKTEASPQ